jgi:hypothetical protein
MHPPRTRRSEASPDRYDRIVRRVRLPVLAIALVGAGVLAVAGFASGASATSIVGSWSGHLAPAPGSHQSRLGFKVVIDRGERRGTWQLGSTCAGTLMLKDISNGYHHYYRVAGAHPRCAAPGIDCLKRAGPKMVDVFVPTSGTGTRTGTFRRVK